MSDQHTKKSDPQATKRLCAALDDLAKQVMFYRDQYLQKLEWLKNNYAMWTKENPDVWCHYFRTFPDGEFELGEETP